MTYYLELFLHFGLWQIYADYLAQQHFPFNPPSFAFEYVWTPLTIGIMKVNIDGSFCGQFVWSNIIGGIFRKHKGNILLQFNKQIKVDSTIKAKLVAVLERLLVAVISVGLIFHPLFLTLIFKLLLRNFLIT